jgi:hypothetical protein
LALTKASGIGIQGREKIVMLVHKQSTIHNSYWAEKGSHEMFVTMIWYHEKTPESDHLKAKKAACRNKARNIYLLD